jgi:hypothetical protein
MSTEHHHRSSHVRRRRLLDGGGDARPLRRNGGRPHAAALGPDAPGRQARHSRRAQGRPLLLARRCVRRAPVAEHLGIPYYVVNQEERFERDVVRPFVSEYLPAARRFRARSATTISSSTSFCRPRAASAQTASPPATTPSTSYDAAARPLDSQAPRRPGQGPDLLPLRPHAGAVGAHALSARPSHQARGARSGAPARAEAGREARLAGDLLHPRRRLQAVPHRLSRGAGRADAGDRRRTGGVKRRSARPSRGHLELYRGPAQGLGVSSPSPLYVLQIDPASHRVTVGADEELATRTLRARPLNWISIAELTGPCACGPRFATATSRPGPRSSRPERRGGGHLRRAAARGHARPVSRVL